MSEQPRTYAQLQTLLADNTTQLISAEDLRDLMATALGGFGNVSVAAGATPQGSLGNTGIKLTCFDTDGQARHTTPDASNDQITVSYDGIYLAILTVSFTGTTNTTYQFELGVNGVAASSGCAERKIGNTNDIGSASAQTLLSLTSGQIVTALVSIIEAPVAQTITVKHADLTLKRIG
jgi:hypothetical protein